MQLRHAPRRPAPPPVTDDDDYVSAGGLAERGWTVAAIRRFLGAPDLTEPGPVFRPAPMLLFDLARVVAAEETEQWRRWREQSVLRAARGRAITEGRRAALLAEVAALDIRVPILDTAKLARLAVAHRNRLDRQRSADLGQAPDPATADTVEPATLHRWMVDYLRQETTVYDAVLDGLYARVGRAEATAAIRDTVYAVIAATYPHLAGEARRQVADRGSPAVPNNRGPGWPPATT
ncbi:hypothetical protein [Actinoplanes palleronii]|nr:hypothetical protein [Actinoplanes palleronii]